MKKFTKAVLVVSCICLCIGIVFTIVGVAMGENIGDVYRDYYKKEYSGSLFNKSEEFKVIYEDRNAVESIKVDIGAGRLEVKQGREFILEGYGDIDEKIEGNAWTIEEKDSIFKFNIFGKNTGNYTLTIPEGIELDTLDMEIGAGEIIIENVTVNELCEIEVGAGSIEVKNGKFHYLNINNGVGDTQITGELFETISVENGAGNIDITCMGAKEEYDFRVDNGIGDIRINGDKVSEGRTGSAEIKKGIFDIDNGVGNVSIKFEN